DATYQFEAYKSHSRPQASLTDIYFHVDAEEESLAKAGIHDALILSKASHYARDLGNMPGNDCTPLYLAEEAKRIGKLKKVKCTVLDEKELKKQGLNALLAVGKGSVIPPRLIILEYKGAGRGTPPIALVGKGITFDTGGIGIKPWLGMPDMKMDMCGAATVLAVLEAAAENALPLNLVGIIPCAENMPSGSAYKPGDIIKTHAGITIEIRHTDAEGRVVLCDALSYVHRYKPRCIIDMATLTGAIIIALGHEYTGLMGNDPSLANELLKAGIESADPAWQLPINENFKKMVDSSIADIANHTDKTAAGSIMGACFLERFVKDVPWAHLDIAGTAMRSSASGRPVSLIMQYLWNQIKSGQ
ncbi:MAG: leucyl aminopeptidase, partial [Gammaproteobacteria bacterium]|nr:leucyl aminopeptidase [Gammaproteobacteria bacterium]